MLWYLWCSEELHELRMRQEAPDPPSLSASARFSLVSQLGYGSSSGYEAGPTNQSGTIQSRSSRVRHAIDVVCPSPSSSLSSPSLSSSSSSTAVL